MFNEVLKRDGLEDKHYHYRFFVHSAQSSSCFYICVLLIVWKPVAGVLLFLMSNHCRGAQSVADKHTCRCNWTKKERNPQTTNTSLDYCVPQKSTHRFSTTLLYPDCLTCISVHTKQRRVLWDSVSEDGRLPSPGLASGFCGNLLQPLRSVLNEKR